MNFTQRLILFIFSICIFLSPSAYNSFDVLSLKFFLIAVLLCFCFSPLRWFSQGESAVAQCAEDEEDSDEDDEEQGLPVMGVPTREKILLLLALFRLRSAEMACIYHKVRYYQKKAGQRNWLILFIKEYTGPWGYQSDNEKEERKAIARSVFKERFNFASKSPIDDVSGEIMDVIAALSFDNNCPEKIIKVLEELKSFGLFEEIISALIKEYSALERAANYGSFDTLFCEAVSENKESLRESLEDIVVLWLKVFKLLKISMVMSKLEKIDFKANGAGTDILLKEIDGLVHLECYLHVAIRQTGEERRTLPLEADEELLLRRIRDNPIYYHYF